MKTLKKPTYAVWFTGSENDPNSICYKGRKVFSTSDYKVACNYRDELLNSHPGCTYIVVELKEIEE